LLLVIRRLQQVVGRLQLVNNEVTQPGRQCQAALELPETEERMVRSACPVSGAAREDAAAIPVARAPVVAAVRVGWCRRPGRQFSSLSKALASMGERLVREPRSKLSPRSRMAST
jgi:hypothetical protein